MSTATTRNSTSTQVWTVVFAPETSESVTGVASTHKNKNAAATKHVVASKYIIQMHSPQDATGLHAAGNETVT